MLYAFSHFHFLKNRLHVYADSWLANYSIALMHTNYVFDMFVICLRQEIREKKHYARESINIERTERRCAPIITSKR